MAPEMSPGEWAVLGVVCEGPTHGFALSQLLGPAGRLGRVWTVPRPVVYQVLKKLLEQGLIAERGTESSAKGPARTIVAATPAGRAALRKWLQEPVDHVRDVRSLLLLKLALLERSGGDPSPLVEAQKVRLAGQLQALARARDAAEGFDRVMLEWRIASSRATLEFLAVVAP